MGKEFVVSSLEDMCSLMCDNVIPKQSNRKDSKSMTECFHCGQEAVVWDSDFDFRDYGYEGEGIVHNCHCTNCGAELSTECF